MNVSNKELCQLILSDITLLHSSLDQLCTATRTLPANDLRDKLELAEQCMGVVMLSLKKTVTDSLPSA